MLPSCSHAYCHVPGHLQKTAVLIESRFPDEFVPLVINFFGFLCPDWKMQLFAAPMTIERTKASQLRQFIASGRLIIFDLSQFKTLAWQGAQAKQMLSNTILTEQSFWNAVQGEKILFFQADSILCSNSRHSAQPHPSIPTILRITPAMLGVKTATKLLGAVWFANFDVPHPIPFRRAAGASSPTEPTSLIG